MGRKKLVRNYTDKDIELELSKYPVETIERYEGSIKDKTRGNLKLIKEIIDDDSEMTSLWYKLVALVLYRKLGGT